MTNLKICYLCFFAVLLMVSCQKTETAKTTHISVLIDVTDENFDKENFTQENLPKFLKLMHLEKETGGFSGGKVKLSLISEVSDSKSKTLEIETGESGLMGENPLTRKDKVVRFYSDLESELNLLLEGSDWGKNSSKIYQKIARESIKMKKQEADQKFLIIYSDMLENSKLFSFYTPNWKVEINTLMKDPENTLEQLSKGGPALPDLSEFEIYIITPRTLANDEKINLSEQFWTILLEYQGATVEFGPGLEV